MIPVTFQPPVGSFDPLALLILALVLDALVGELPFLFQILPHPVRIIGGTIAALEKKLNREKRSQVDRAFRGLVLLVFMLALAALLGHAVVRFTAWTPHGWALELFLMVTLIAQRSLFDHVRAVGSALRDKGLAAAREKVALIVGRDVERLDEHAVARAAIESAAENFSDGVVAPVFWYVLFGFPGLLIYKTVNTLDSMVGHKNERFRAFGVTSARLDDVMNWIPARLSALILALAAIFVPTASPFRALKIAVRDSRKHRSPNAGWPEAAMAGALGLALSGPRAYGGEANKEPWIGEELRARAGHQDIKRALYMLAIGCLLHLGLILGLLLWKLYR